MDASTVINSPTLPKSIQGGSLGDPASLLDNTVRAQEKLSAQETAETAPIAADLKAAQDDFAKASAEPRPKANLPEPPKHAEQKDLTESATTFMALGALAGLLTRRPMTAALNNMTAAIEGTQKGDREAYDKAFAEYKTNFDKAMKVNDEMLAERKGILNNKRLTIQDKENQIHLLNVKYGALQKGVQTSFLDTFKVMDAQSRLAEQARIHDATIRHQDAQIRLGWAKEGREAAGMAGGVGHPFDDTKHGEDFLQTLPANERALVKDIANGKINPTTLSTKGGHRENIMSKVAQYKEDYSQQDFGSEAAALKAFTTGKQGNAVRSFNVSISHINTLEHLADALANGDTKLINKWSNEFAAQTGSPAPTTFDATKKIVADEITKGIIGGPGGVGDREENARAVASWNSPAQIKGTTKTWKELMGGQLNGLRKQYEESTGRHDFDRFLSDDTKKQLGAGKPQPTDADKAWAKESAANKASYLKHFGVEP